MQIINVIQISNGIVAGIASFPVDDDQLLGCVRQEVEDYCLQIMKPEFPFMFMYDFEYYFEDDVYDDNKGYRIQIVSSEI